MTQPARSRTSAGLRAVLQHARLTRGDTSAAVIDSLRLYAHAQRHFAKVQRTLDELLGDDPHLPRQTGTLCWDAIAALDATQPLPWTAETIREALTAQLKRTPA